jgi:hypothetical protein
MKKSTLLLFSIVSFHTLIAQQWIDKKYTYDSTLNMAYGTSTNFLGGIDTLKMDIYMPKCGDSLGVSTKPLILFIHGGAFIAGSKDEQSITALCKNFAQRGYITASVDYRLGFISDDKAWNCNYPNYSCVFATDSAEWYRAYYRGVQDAKGALRYLVNRHQQLNLDTVNIFVAGESAGAFVSLGVALMDTASERLPQTFKLDSVPQPHSQTKSCVYNAGRSFGTGNIARPDLGPIEGTIEPTSIKYQLKGVGNFYGGMMNDLLKNTKSGSFKPAIYSFHQPCDLVVPIDSGVVYQGLSWCMANGYNCNRVVNTASVYGSRAFSNWNTNGAYGYTIQNEFTATNFPYNFLFGPGSCADQVNNPCHAYDNKILREENLAAFFSSKVSTSPVCDTGFVMSVPSLADNDVSIYPNPFTNLINIDAPGFNNADVQIFSISGQIVMSSVLNKSGSLQLDFSDYHSTLFFVRITDVKGRSVFSRVVKVY